MMDRVAALRILAPSLDDAVVIAVYSTAFDWVAVAPDHRFTLTNIAAMGLASSYALGLATAMPQRKVVVLDGDGSSLMNLGSFVTIGGAAPNNLIHVVMENGAYEANGGHPIPGGSSFSFAGLARAASYRAAHEFSDTDELARRFPDIAAGAGPVFVDLKVKLVTGRSFSEAQYKDLYGPARTARFIESIRGEARG